MWIYPSFVWSLSLEKWVFFSFAGGSDGCALPRNLRVKETLWKLNFLFGYQMLLPLSLNQFALYLKKPNKHGNSCQGVVLLQIPKKKRVFYFRLLMPVLQLSFIHFFLSIGNKEHRKNVFIPKIAGVSGDGQHSVQLVLWRWRATRVPDSCCWCAFLVLWRRLWISNGLLSPMRPLAPRLMENSWRSCGIRTEKRASEHLKCAPLSPFPAFERF